MFRVNDVGSQATTVCKPMILFGIDRLRMIGCGHTFDLIFSKLAGEVREKQSRKTSVWGYESGRSRLSC